MTPLNFAPVLPEIVLLVGACVVLIGDLFLPEAKRHVSFWLTQLVLAVAAVESLATLQVQPGSAFSGDDRR